MTAKATDLLVVVNPHAGCGRGLKTWDKLLQRKSELRQARLINQADASEADSQLRAALAERRFSRVLVLGGDGTIQMVLNRLLQLPEALRPILAFARGGTGSDFSRLLDLPTNPVDAAEAVINAPAGAVDVMALRSEDRLHYGLNVASVGISSLVAPRVNADPRHGKLSYIWHTLRSLTRFNPPTIALQVDDRKLEDEARFLIAIANGRSFGNGLKIAPHARADDGLLEVVIVDPMSAFELPLRMIQLLLGKHLSARPVSLAQGQKITLSATTRQTLEVDGETFDFTQLQVEVLPRALQLAHFKEQASH
ncbi:MAG: lipid kinase [Lysobacteraceae bacterium]|nr:MAG: lipid kinase [Xanthomonadaceae bacterium]